MLRAAAEMLMQHSTLRVSRGGKRGLGGTDTQSSIHNRTSDEFSSAPRQHDERYFPNLCQLMHDLRSASPHLRSVAALRRSVPGNAGHGICGRPPIPAFEEVGGALPLKPGIVKE